MPRIRFEPWLPSVVVGRAAGSMRVVPSLPHGDMRSCDGVSGSPKLSSDCRREFTLVCRGAAAGGSATEQLMVGIATTSWSAVGRKYGVSDNAIRKWVRAYEVERESALEPPGELAAAVLPPSGLPATSRR